MNGPAEITAQSDPALLAGLHEAYADQPWDAGAMARLLGLPQTAGFIAAQEKLPCGLVLARVTGDDCEILTIGVLPAERRQGIGAALLDTAGNWASRLGANRLVLEVAEDNRAALLLYESAGFDRCGSRPAYYRACREGKPRRDALILQMSLDGCAGDWR